MKNLPILEVAVLALLPMAALHAQLAPPTPQPTVADAKPGDIRIVATGAFNGPLEAVRQQMQAAVGKPLFIQYGSARGNLKTMVLAGQACEVTLLLPDVDQVLAKEDKVEAKQYKIASVPAAFAVSGNPPKLDMSTKEGIKTALLNASAVYYGPTGAAHDAVDKILDTLNIRSTIKDANKLGKKISSGTLAPGEYEMGIYPLSEILANKSLKSLGPVIPELQVPVVIEASICKSAANRAAADAVVKFLLSPALDAPLKASGMNR